VAPRQRASAGSSRGAVVEDAVIAEQHEMRLHARWRHSWASRCWHSPISHRPCPRAAAGHAPCCRPERASPWPDRNQPFRQTAAGTGSRLKCRYRRHLAPLEIPGDLDRSVVQYADAHRRIICARGEPTVGNPRMVCKMAIDGVDIPKSNGLRRSPARRRAIQIRAQSRRRARVCPRSPYPWRRK